MHKSRFLTLIAVPAIALLLAGCSRVAEDWSAAQAANTTEAYQDFLQQHADSEYSVQAQARIKQLAEDRDWQQASTADTRDAYEQFIAQHADGKWAQEARIRVENFQLSGATAEPAAIAPPVAAAAAAAAPVAAAPPAPTPSGHSAYYAQLGAFGTKANAESEWRRVLTRFPAQLKSLQPRYITGQSQSKTVYRLRVGVPSEQRARELCAALKKQSQACVPVAG